MLTVKMLTAKYAKCQHTSTKNRSFKLQISFKNKFSYAPDPAKTVTYIQHQRRFNFYYEYLCHKELTEESDAIDKLHKQDSV